MRRSPLVAPLCCLAALGAAACSRAPQPEASAAQSPPPGIRYEANVSAGGVAPPAVEIRNPHPGVAANATAGANLFASMNCDGCHGGGAPGWVGPSLIDGRWRYGGADEAVFSSIFYGRPKGMPAYGGVVGAEGVWMLVAYLKAQSVPSVVPTTSYEDMDRAPPAGTAAAVPQPTATAPTAAKTPDQMITDYGCVACHAVDHKVVGPAFTDVAAKYKGKDVESTLAEKVRNGGSGVWGTIPMAPNPQVPDQDLHTLIKWVLAR
jgi:cytochrome c551/c552